MMKTNRFFLAYLLMSLCSVQACFASSILLQWDPNTETDLAGYKVYYKANSAELPFDGAGAIEGVAPIDVANQTTATLTGLDPGTDYYFAVTAYNTSGMESVYSEIITVPKVTDTAIPTVSLTSPAAATTVSGTVGITATASDDVAVSRVEFYANDTLVAASNVSPYSCNWDTTTASDGAYTVMAKAYDAAGNSATSSAQVNVVNDAVAPSITTLVLPETSTSASVPVSLAASDNVAVTGYLVSEASATPATTDSRWTATAPATFAFSGEGAHTLYAWAKDAAGNVSAGSAASVVIDTTAPSIAAPSLTLANQILTVAASATDNITVTKMQLYLDSALQTEASANTVSFQARVGKVTHRITVKAFDAAGNFSTRIATVRR